MATHEEIQKTAERYGLTFEQVEFALRMREDPEAYATYAKPGSGDGGAWTSRDAAQARRDAERRAEAREEAKRQAAVAEAAKELAAGGEG